jgi:hypothetical protein
VAQSSIGAGKKPKISVNDVDAAANDFFSIPPEQATLMLGWSLRTLERRNADGTGPKITKTGPRSRSVQVGRIRKFLAECDADKAA